MQYLKQILIGTAIGAAVVTSGLFAWEASQDGKGTLEHRVVEPSAVPSEAVKYYAATQIASALTAGGIECGTFATIHPLTEALDMGSCQEGSLVISIFASSEDTQAAPTNLYTLMDGTEPIVMILGPNWAINCDVPDCDGIANVLHGEMIRLSVEK
jgi:hypothetical protein